MECPVQEVPGWQAGTPPGPLNPARSPAAAELLRRCTFPAPGTSVVCALSGGPDSTALAILAVAGELDVTAVHVNHGLRASADHDAEVAERATMRLGIGFRLEHARLDDGANLEARARAARSHLIGPGALTGHTADDQAETVLLALLRGSGATGLAAITPGTGHPILRLRRHETAALCAAMGFETASDPSNSDPRFRRNRVRAELVTLMDSIADRDVTELLIRTADLLRDDDAFLDDLADAVDPTDAHALARAPLPLARRAIRRWLTIDGHPPDSASVARVLDVAHGRCNACEVRRVGQIRRSHQRLRVIRPES